MTIFSVFNTLYIIIDGSVTIVVSLAVVFFLWGMAKFILKADDETERAKGKQIMIWGLLTLFVMVSVWGIINFLQLAFFGGASTTPGWDIPTF